MQVKKHFFAITPDDYAHLPVKMQFLVEKYGKHLLKWEIIRNFVVEFIASAMAVPLRASYGSHADGE